MNRTFKIHCSQIGKIMGNGKSGNLPVTCQTYLKEWYAQDREPIHSKYLDKGNWVEQDLIDFMAVQLGYGMAEKNTDDPVQDEYFIGTCDVIRPDTIIDVKAPWNRKTLQDNCCNMDEDYEYQLRGYMRLYDRPKAILFYGLMNTPAECNYDNEVIYDNLPDHERWIAFSINRDTEIEQIIIDRVIKCREWLDEYDQLITERMGRVHVI